MHVIERVACVLKMHMSNGIYLLRLIRYHSLSHVGVQWSLQIHRLILLSIPVRKERNLAS